MAQAAPPLSLDDPQLYAQGFPHPHFDLIRANGPVHWSAGNNPFFAVVGYDTAVTVLKDPGIYSSGLGGISIDDPAPEIWPAFSAMLPVLDPPEHMALRQHLFPALKPGAIAGLRADLERRCNELLTQACARGECDFVDAIAAEIPIAAFGALMGLTRAELVPLRVLSDEVITHGANDSTDAIARLFDYFERLVDERRARPRDDYLTLLARVETGDRPMSRIERNGMLLQIVIGGLETTRSAMAGTLVELDRRREQWLQLRDHPGLIDNAVEESLRHVSPVNYVRRTTRVDTVLGDTTIPAGARVVVWLGAANRDPARFTAPHDFDIGRNNARQHLALGAGEHFCMGAALARLQLVTFWQVFSQRVAEFRVMSLDRIPSVQQNALRCLRVELRAAP